MAEERVQRRLAAILIADVVGFSRMMGADEEGTLAALTFHRTELIEPCIAEHRGRVVKMTGDGLLAEFASIIDAVRCALAVQVGMENRDADASEERRIAFRIGVNLGDVIVQDDDVFGDGVNVAARLEALADPGGICASGKVFEEVRGKLVFDFEDLGQRDLKNIAQPVQAYRIRPATAPNAPRHAVDVSKPVPGFGGRPAIAVLPFDNMSGDPEQEYLVDGIVEDILTRLAMWRWLPVIARNSSFVYKGRSVDVKEVGRSLGARYVLEGSVRRVGDRVRITGQLVDAETGHHVWAERYDRVIEDVFDLQDEITGNIVSALEPALGQAETQRVRLKPPTSLDAWELYHRAFWHWSRATRADLAESRRVLKQAIELDSGFALPHSLLAKVATFEVLFGASKNPQETLHEALREAQMAINLDSMDAFAHTGMCQALVFMRQHDNAIAAGRRAIELNPSLALGHHVHGVALFFSGRGDEAVHSIERGIRLSPRDVLLHYLFMGLGAANLTARKYDAAVEATTTSIGILARNPLGLRFHASALAHAGRIEEAKAALQRATALAPGLTSEALRQATPYRNSADFEHYLAGLRKAGWDG